jgi:membrane-associated protease RseP (regulator of RpoE activity)
MNRTVKVAAILLLLGFMVLIWSAFRTHSSVGPRAPSAVSQAIDHPVDFAKNHFTGGIGVLLGTDHSGLTAVEEVLNGSPASNAGLREGDAIIEINGVATKGKALAQVTGEIRGITGGEINLTIQRAGSTNQEVTLHRSSWSHLGRSPYSTSPATPAIPGLPPTTVFILTSAPPGSVVAPRQNGNP